MKLHLEDIHCHVIYKERGGNPSVKEREMGKRNDDRELVRHRM